MYFRGLRSAQVARSSALTVIWILRFEQRKGLGKCDVCGRGPFDGAQGFQVVDHRRIVVETTAVELEVHECLPGISEQR